MPDVGNGRGSAGRQREPGCRLMDQSDKADLWQANKIEMLF